MDFRLPAVLNRSCRLDFAVLTYFLMRGILISAFLSLAIAGIAGCSGGQGSSTTGHGGATSAMQVSMSDSPADQLLSLELTVNSIVLTSTSGATEGVLPAATTVEISHLQATAQPLSLVTLPQGTYTGATVDISNVAATYVNLSGQIAQATFSGTFSVPLTFSPSLVVGSSTVALNLELNLAQSLQTFVPAAFSPVITAAPANVGAASQQLEGTGGVHDLTGVVTGVGSASFTMTASQVATSLTVDVDSSTQFAGVSGLSGLAAGDIVEIDATTQSDSDALLASSVQAEAGIKMEAEGVVVSRTAGSPNSFRIAVQNSAGTGAPSPGTLLTVTADSTTTFIVPSNEADLSGLSFTPAFSAFANLQVGQRVEVSTTSDFNSVATQVQLALQTLRGVTTSQNGSQYTLVPPDTPVDSAFFLLTGAGSIDFFVQPTTQLDGLSSIVLSTPLHVRGLVFFDAPSGRYKLVATRVAP